MDSGLQSVKKVSQHLDPEVVFIDGTHIKANANLKKHIKKVIPQTARHYGEQLMDEINQNREAHKKKPFDDDDSKPPKGKTICESTTDPDQIRRTVSFHQVREQLGQD